MISAFQPKNKNSFPLFCERDFPMTISKNFFFSKNIFVWKKFRLYWNIFIFLLCLFVQIVLPHFQNGQESAWTAVFGIHLKNLGLKQRSQKSDLEKSLIHRNLNYEVPTFLSRNIKVPPLSWIWFSAEGFRVALWFFFRESLVLGSPLSLFRWVNGMLMLDNKFSIYHEKSMSVRFLQELYVWG